VPGSLLERHRKGFRCSCSTIPDFTASDKELVLGWYRQHHGCGLHHFA
jgi:hypothetical protein